MASDVSSLGSIFVALTGLVLVLVNVLKLQLAHPLDFVEVDDETLFVSMVWFDALATKNRQMVGAVEVLDSLLV